MADVDTHEHSLLTDLVAEGHAPEVTTELGVHLTNDIEEDTVIIFGDSPVGDELGDDGTVTVNLVLQEGVEVLVVAVIRHNNQENEVRVLDSAIRGLNSGQHFLVVVVLDTRGESFQKILLMDGCAVRDGADIGVFYSDVKTLLLGKVVELVIDVVSVLNVLLEANDGESLECLGLVDH